MAESDVLVASAVVLPETVEEEKSPTLPQKRRQSTASVTDTKRPRLDDHDDHASKKEDRSTFTQDADVRGRPSREIDERKRGKRLFGALLGTLSQNSSSTAQKRRTDIEKKQREKLKLQAEEDDEKKKQRLQNLVEERKREQEIYDKQTTSLVQTNMLATAHFLKTKTEPVLYYKPWELRPEEKAQIELQISKVDESLHRENQEPPHNNPEKGMEGSASPENIIAANEDLLEVTGELDKTTNEPEEPTGAQSHDANTPPDGPIDPSKADGSQEATKDTVDEGGDDMVEGEEDAVIY